MRYVSVVISHFHQYLIRPFVTEGLMLKPLSSKYNDHARQQKWVKLKKDFIPGAGDTLDSVVVGASWQKKRGRELLGELGSVVYLSEQAHSICSISSSLRLYNFLHRSRSRTASCTAWCKLLSSIEKPKLLLIVCSLTALKQEALSHPVLRLVRS